jgi:hypothetical protein
MTAMSSNMSSSLMTGGKVVTNGEMVNFNALAIGTTLGFDVPTPTVGVLIQETNVTAASFSKILLRPICRKLALKLLRIQHHAQRARNGVPLQTLLIGPLIDRTTYELGSVVATDLARQTAALLQLFQHASTYSRYTRLSWDDKQTGAKHYRDLVYVDKIEFLDWKGSGNGQTEPAGSNHDETTVTDQEPPF